MTLDKDDLRALGNMIESSLDNRLGKKLEKVGDVVDKRVEDKLGKDLEKVGGLIDTKMIDFFQTVTLPAIENILESYKNDTENNFSRLERKIDNIADNLSDKVLSHEKRITKLESVVIVS